MPDSVRNRSPPRGRTKGRSVAQVRRGIPPGTGSCGEEQRAPGDGLPRGIADTAPTPPEDAGIAETNAGRRIGITISEDGGGGRSKIPTTGREPGGISQQVAGSGRSAGHRGATADSAAAAEGSSDWRQHDYAAPFDSDSTIRAGVQRIAAHVFPRHPTTPAPTLSFPVGQSLP